MTMMVMMIQQAAIQQENCFGGLEDQCVEKRIFYRYLKFNISLTFAIVIIRIILIG